MSIHRLVDRWILVQAARNMPFLIDGHNVIATLPDIDLEDPDDEAKLVVKLRAWSWRERAEVAAAILGR